MLSGTRSLGASNEGAAAAASEQVTTNEKVRIIFHYSFRAATGRKRHHDRNVGRINHAPFRSRLSSKLFPPPAPKPLQPCSSAATPPTVRTDITRLPPAL